MALKNQEEWCYTRCLNSLRRFWWPTLWEALRTKAKGRWNYLSLASTLIQPYRQHNNMKSPFLNHTFLSKIPATLDLLSMLQNRKPQTYIPHNQSPFTIRQYLQAEEGMYRIESENYWKEWFCQFITSSLIFFSMFYQFLSFFCLNHNSLCC